MWRIPQSSSGLSLLGHVLLETPASPLRKALLESGLGDEPIGAGLANYLQQPYFSFGLKGVEQEKCEEVHQLIFDTLQELIQTGLDPLTIEASFNTVEFQIRELNTGDYPRGLSVMLNLLSNWLYDRDPMGYLHMDKHLATLKAQVSAQPDYFTTMIQKFFLDNEHRTTLILEPDPEMAERLEQEEVARLQKKQASLSETDRLEIVTNTQRLIQLQEQVDPPEAMATIPMLSKSDLDKEIKTIPTEQTTIGTTPPFTSSAFHQ